MSTPRGVALLLLALGFSVAHAQTVTTVPAAPPPAIDPSQPLPPLPDLGVAWPTAAAPPAEPTQAATESDTVVHYRFEVKGLEGTGAEAEFRALSALRTTKERANLAQIETRAKADEALLDRLMRAHGYYGAAVAHKTTPAAAAGQQATVTLTVTPGPRYTFAAVEVVAPPGAPLPLIQNALALAPGKPVDATQVLAARDRVQLALPNAGYPFAEVPEPDIVVDHDTRTAHYKLTVNPGPPARFGALTVRGKPDLGQKHLLIIARFAPGDTYNQALVDDFRRALIATSLYASVQIRPERHVAPDGHVDADLAIAVTPAKPRTIAAQIGYDTVDGFRLQTSWRNRNFRNPEGALTVNGVVGTQEQSLGSDLNFSNWRKRDQSLDLAASIAHLRTAAFISNTIDFAAQIQRKTTLIFQKKWTYSYGPELSVSSERERSLLNPVTRQYFVIALPGTLGYDGSNDVLDPTRGFRLNGRVSPEASLRGNFTYLRLRQDATGYYPVGRKIVLAGRVAVGAIVGAPVDAIPLTRRYYVGGGGSVRGYGYQGIGPRDAANVPLGGRSFTEFSGEIRYRLTNTIGLVPFFDGGQLYNSEFPKFGSFQYGAGLGVRYYSAFGPIRFDVASPVNPRRNDPKVAIYVSIGQSF